MLTRDVLKNYLLDMPRGHIFDLTFSLFADVFPPGGQDANARQQLRVFADECDCDLAECASGFDLTRR